MFGGDQISIGHLDFAGTDKRTTSDDRRDLILFQQHFDTAGQGRDDFVFAFHHGRNIDTDVFDPDPVIGEMIASLDQQMA